MADNGLFLVAGERPASPRVLSVARFFGVYAPTVALIALAYVASAVWYLWRGDAGTSYLWFVVVAAAVAVGGMSAFLVAAPRSMQGRILKATAAGVLGALAYPVFSIVTVWMPGYFLAVEVGLCAAALMVSIWFAVRQPSPHRGRPLGLLIATVPALAIAAVYWLPQPLPSSAISEDIGVLILGIVYPPVAASVVTALTLHWSRRNEPSGGDVITDH